ncbi:MAG: cation:proton antiporter [Candidatus Nanohaloarchaea archaeon]|nr:cation:proton antiporter [Candidatus Nanohaloarchaea archaeon]
MAGESILFDVGVIILSATVLATAAKFLRQPLLAAYILAGILIGPEVLGIVQNTGIIRMFAELGVAFLLFMVGLELDLSRLREVRSVVLGAALTEVLFLFSLGYFVMYLLGFRGFDAIYIGLFIAFNSTAVLVKILSDSGDLETLHGRIILGILLVEDVLVVMVLSIMSSLSDPGLHILVASLVQGAGLFALAIVLSNYIVPHFFRLVEDSHELIFLASLSVLFAFVGAAVETGFSTAVGGFLAGISLTAFPYNVEIAERARTLRDFFVTIFFVSLGMLVSIESLYRLLVPFLILLFVVTTFKPFFVSLMVSLFRYGKRTSFYTGSSLSQISEFSMVLALLGLSLGHIGKGIFSLVTALMVVSITGTSYILKYQKTLYGFFERFMFEFEGATYEEGRSEKEDHVVLVGGHVKGRRILRILEEMDEKMVVIDHDPEVVEWARDRELDTVYGDIEDYQTMERANFGQAKAVISTVPDAEDNRFLLDHVKKDNPDAVTIVSAEDMESSLLLYEEGADYVLYPKILAAREAADMVQKVYSDGEELEEARKEHIEDLEEEFEEEILRRVEPNFLKKLKERMKGVGDEGDSEGG